MRTLFGTNLMLFLLVALPLVMTAYLFIKPKLKLMPLRRRLARRKGFMRTWRARTFLPSGFTSLIRWLPWAKPAWEIKQLPLGCRGILRAQFANIGEGRHSTGHKTYAADAAITTRYLMVKAGSDANHIAVAGAADIPLGPCTDEATAAEDLVNVALLGAVAGTQLAVASEAIADGEEIVPAAGGKVRKLPAGAGTYHILGRASIPVGMSVADDVPIAFIPNYPTPRVVT